QLALRAAAPPAREQIGRLERERPIGARLDAHCDGGRAERDALQTRRDERREALAAMIGRDELEVLDRLGRLVCLVGLVRVVRAAMLEDEREALHLAL